MDATFSLDVGIFREMEREAELQQVSIPELCSMAIREYLQNRHKTTITEQINAVFLICKSEIAEDILQAQYDGLPEEDW